MAKHLDEWLQEGTLLYEVAVEDYRKLEEQALQIQERLAAKRQEVNQIAKVISKPPVEEPHVGPAGSTYPPVDVVDPNQPGATPYTRNSIARALTGQPIRR